jgi:diguanylate cyclase (GGDEF)-like protein
LFQNVAAVLGLFAELLLGLLLGLHRTRTFMVSKPTVLIVDDHITNIQILHSLLGEELDIRVATNGPDALRLIHASPPDLVLLDVEMPHMSGYEVCAALKASEETLHIPVIFITAHSESEQEAEGFKVGAVDFVAKPFRPEVVKARVRTHLLLKRQSDLLRNLAFMDGLTGVSNRRRFDQALEAEWRRCRRNGASLSLLMIDVDRFKLYNDHYGHLAGDACLQRVASTMAKQLLRSHDLLVRYGGEEFACLLPDCDLAGALGKAEALRTAVAALEIEHRAAANGRRTVSISAGVASVVPHDPLGPADLVAAADAQLYLAKSRGRDCVSSD